MSLLSIYIVSSNKGNNTFSLNSFNTDVTLMMHLLDNSDNADKDLSFYSYKNKSALKIKIKDKSYIISTSVLKK